MTPAAAFVAFSVAFLASVFSLVPFGFRGWAISGIVVAAGVSAVFWRRLSAWAAALAGTFLAFSAYGVWSLQSESFLRSVRLGLEGREPASCLETEGVVTKVSASGILFETDSFGKRGTVFAKVPSGALPKPSDRAAFCLWPSDGRKTAYESRLGKVGVATGIKSSLPTLIGVPTERAGRNLSILVNRLYPSENSALVRWMVLGDGSGIDETWTLRYQKSGLSHLVVASGGNIAILAGMLSFFVIRLRPWIGTSVLLVSIWGYAALAGFGIPIVRAAVMASAAIALRPFGKTDPTNLLFATAIGFLLFDPWLAIDLSFLLSFSATLGICRLSGPLERWLRAVPERLEFRSTVAATVAATVATVPISIATFWGASIVSVVSNVLVAATVVPIAAVSVIAMFFESLGLGAFATWAAFPGHLLASFVNSVAERSAEIPYGYWTVGNEWVGTALLSAFAATLSFSAMAEGYSMGSKSNDDRRFWSSESR